MTPLPLASEIALAGLVVVAAVYDIRLRRIPNWLAAAGFCLGFILNTPILRLDGLALAGLGAMLALAIYLPLFTLRAMAGGDVTLMGAICALTGPRHVIFLLLLTPILLGL